MNELLLERPWFGAEADGRRNMNKIAGALLKNWKAWKGSMGVSDTADNVADFINHQYTNMASSMQPLLQQLGATPSTAAAGKPATASQTPKPQPNTQAGERPAWAPPGSATPASGSSTANPTPAPGSATPAPGSSAANPTPAPEANPGTTTQSVMAQLPQMLQNPNPDPNTVLQTIAKASNLAKTPAEFQHLRALIKSLQGNAGIVQKIPQLATLGESSMWLREAAMLSSRQLQDFFLQMARSMMKQQKIDNQTNPGAQAASRWQQANSRQKSQKQNQPSSNGTSFRQLLGSPVDQRAAEMALFQNRIPDAEIDALFLQYRRGMTLSDLLKTVTTPAISGKTLNILLGTM